MLFELRAYDFAPGIANRYLDLFQSRGLPHVTRHLPLAGYWLTDSGPLNRLYHLWIYQNLSERAASRASLMGDRNWTEGFVPPGFALISSQHTTMMRLEQGSKVLEGAVDRRRNVHEARAAGAPLFANSVMALVWGDGAPPGAQLVAAWTAISGDTAGQAVSLYSITDVDGVLDGVPLNLQLLRPCLFSPLQ